MDKAKNITTASTANEPDFISQAVCNESDLKDNEMKIFKFGDAEVLLVKQNKQISALGTKCPHYGAPLDKAFLGDGRIKCHWHGACFNLANGDIEDFPGLDSLPCHQVYLKNGQIIVKANKALLKSNKRQPNFIARNFSNNETFIVAGGGPAGTVSVENLRQLGFTGRLIFILGENYLPYDRVKLTKAMDMKYEDIQLRTEEFYRERNVEILKGTRVLKIDASLKNLKLSNEHIILYDKILFATGSTARNLNCKGASLENIFTLRTIDDANAISNAVSVDSNIVIVGSSFIGLEAAAWLSQKGAKITIIGKGDAPLQSLFGKLIAQRIQKMFEENNIKFYNSSTIDKFIGVEKVTGVVVKGSNSLEIPADIVIIGIGVKPSTEYLEGVDIKLATNKAIIVNKFLETSLKDVYAAGDCSYAPILSWEATIGHWGLAQYHGKLAAENMMGRNKSIDTVPFFWSQFFGKSFRYCGFAPDFKRVIIRGDLDNLCFVGFYLIGDERVGAVVTCQRDPVAAMFGEELRKGVPLCVDHIDDWLAKLK